MARHKARFKITRATVYMTTDMMEATGFLTPGPAHSIAKTIGRGGKVLKRRETDEWIVSRENAKGQVTYIMASLLITLDGKPFINLMPAARTQQMASRPEKR